MKLKRAILSALNREALKAIVDGLELDRARRSPASRGQPLSLQPLVDAVRSLTPAGNPKGAGERLGVGGPARSHRLRQLLGEPSREPLLPRRSGHQGGDRLQPTAGIPPHTGLHPAGVSAHGAPHAPRALSLPARHRGPGQRIGLKLRSTPSADPGAKTGAGDGKHLAPLPFCQLRDWHEREKPPRQDAATSPAGCPLKLANAERQEFQFPVNQDRFYPRFMVKSRRISGPCMSAGLDP